MNDSITTDEVINCFSIRNDGDISRQLTDNVHYVTVELPKFRKDVSALKSLTDRMIWLLGNMGSLKEVPEEFSDFINYDKLGPWRDFTGLRNELDYLITKDGARVLGSIRKPMTLEEVYRAKNM